MNRALIIIWTLLASSGLAAQVTTSLVYQQNRDRVVQIRVIDISADSKAAIGSGFIAGQSDWVVTNYHVVAEMVNNPVKNRVEWLADDNRSGELSLLAVDSVHDLALLRGVGLDEQPLSLSDQPPARGSRVYAMGNPFDLGMTIVEGNYNGLLEKSLYEKIHFTGSINPGMSGGPALDESGAVVGVNVATAGNQVSFLVPAFYVGALLSEGQNSTDKEMAFEQQVAGQLLSNQARYIEDLLLKDLTTTRLNGYIVPGALADYINCWGNSSTDASEPISLVRYRCQTSDDIFLSSLHTTGIVRYQHELLTTEQLAAWQFYKQLENRAQYPQLLLSGDEQAVTDYACQNDFIRHGNLDLKVIYCLRGYRKFTGLFDAYMTVVSLINDKEALQSSLVLGGVSRQNAQQFSKNFLQAFSYQP